MPDTHVSIEINRWIEAERQTSGLLIRVANAALDDLTGEVASWRVSSELHAVALRLGEFPAVPGVALFLARYRAYRKS